MANIKSAKKAIKQTQKKRKYNLSNKSMLRTFIKKVYKAIKNKDKNTAKREFITAQKCLDKQTTKKLIHKNRSARYKSNILKKIKSIP